MAAGGAGRPMGGAGDEQEEYYERSALQREKL